MSILFVEGDLFENKYHAEAFAHGCNCQGVMGAGIAKRMKEEFPLMYQRYRQQCKARPKEFKPGSVMYWREEGRIPVFNLGTQEFYGKFKVYATYENVRKALEAMKHVAMLEKISRIAIPYVGTGYGGLEVLRVKEIIESLFTDWDGVLRLYEKFNK